MSIPTRGLGAGLLVTRGLGSNEFTQYITGEIDLRIDRMLDAALLVDLRQEGDIRVDRHQDEVARTDSGVGWTMRFDIEKPGDMKVSK